MRTRILTLVALLTASSLLAQDTDPVPPKLTKEDIAKAEKAVKAHLAKIKGDYAQVQHISDEPVGKALPGFAFFSVLYRQYPVGRTPPAGLKVSNILAAGRDGKVIALTDAKELQKFVKEKLPTAGTDAQIKDVARAMVRLGQELHQDGFYRFRLEDDSTKVTDGKRSKIATARAVVMQGGNGSYSVTLMFTGGKLTALSESVKLKPGPRPICQATKLLDRDPIVRAMAEQALLCMGRAAKPYLDEQRAKASPELKKAIDAIWRRIVEDDR
jgi:hypothetical protein